MKIKLLKRNQNPLYLISLNLKLKNPVGSSSGVGHLTIQFPENWKVCFNCFLFQERKQWLKGGWLFFVLVFLAPLETKHQGKKVIHTYVTSAIASQTQMWPHSHPQYTKAWAFWIRYCSDFCLQIFVYNRVFWKKEKQHTQNLSNF